MPNALHLSLQEYDHMVRVGAFDRIARKVELIAGELIEVNPAGPLHDSLVSYLTEWSVDQRDRSRTRITSQTGLDLPDQVSRPEPDLMWLRKASYRDHHPVAADVQLAIEVAHSSLAYDLQEKRQLYAQASIVEYWIVDVQAKCIHVFIEPADGDYQQRQLFKPGETLAPKIASTAKLDIKDLFEES